MRAKMHAAAIAARFFPQERFKKNRNTMQFNLTPLPDFPHFQFLAQHAVKLQFSTIP
jgi:hypothetical protein